MTELSEESRIERERIDRVTRPARDIGERYEARDMNGHLRIYIVGGDSWNAPCSVNCGCDRPDWNS